MINTNVFDYVNVLNKAADAAWTRNDVLANNIANMDTPGYKRQDVDFESQLKQAMRSTRFKSVDARVGAINDTELETRVYTDASSFSDWMATMWILIQKQPGLLRTRSGTMDWYRA